MPNNTEWLSQEVIGGIVTTVLLFVVGLSVKPVRLWLFYRQHEYEFEYDSDFRGCEWDIQWERMRLTIQVTEVHNDYLKDVTIKLNAQNPGEKFDQLKVAGNFHEPQGWPIHFKLNSIVRTRPGAGVREYLVNFIVRRRRW